MTKLKTPDSKFEIKTPTSIAAVRGTAFETNVAQNADGTTSVTYKVDDGRDPRDRERRRERRRSARASR